MPEITVHSSWLSSVLPKKDPTAHSSGLSSNTVKASATTLLDCKTQEPTGRTQKVRPSISISITSCRHGISNSLYEALPSFRSDILVLSKAQEGVR